jgi:hypothetical protein
MTSGSRRPTAAANSALSICTPAEANIAFMDAFGKKLKDTGEPSLRSARQPFSGRGSDQR